MKKLLLSTAALSFVLVGAAFAEEPRTAGQMGVFVIEPSAGHEHDHAAEVVEKAAEQMEEQAAEAVEEAVVEDVVVEGAEAVEPVEAAEPVAEAVDEMQADMEVEPAVAQPVPEEEALAAEMDTHQHSSHGDWGYSGAKSAPYWGTLNEAYQLCTSGKAQSPINIAKFLQEDLPDLIPAYNPSPLAVVNNGHSIQVDYASGSGFRADSVNYNLKHFHFHTPSEHYLDGAPYPMEVHFVHQANDGTLAVIGVMMKIGEHNKIIEGIWQNAPITAGDSKRIDSVELNAADLMPASLEYYKYDGSLTTPPCTEGVRWHVLKEPIEISEIQLKAFQALFPVNARPVQPLNDRVVTGD